MAAAQDLKGLSKPSEVAELLGLDNPSQTMHNWSQRGVPPKEFNRVSRALGCHPFWIEDGDGDMIYDKLLDADLKIAVQLMQPLRPYGRQAAIKEIAHVAELIEQAQANEK